MDDRLIAYEQILKTQEENNGKMAWQIQFQT